MKCYEIKNCIFSGTNHCDSKCPPHKLQLGCWEYYRVSFYKSMPDNKEKLGRRQVMLDNCPNCVVYSSHKKDIDIILNGLKNQFSLKI